MVDGTPPMDLLSGFEEMNLILCALPLLNECEYTGDETDFIHCTELSIHPILF